ALLEPYAFLTHPIGQPVMLVEANPSREGKVGTHAKKHASPAGIVDVDIVLNDPTLGELKMPAVRRLVADGDHDACRLARFENDDDCVRFGTLEVGINELVTTAFRSIQHGDFCVFRPAFQPLLEVVGDAMQ